MSVLWEARQLGSSGLKAIAGLFLNPGCAVCDRATSTTFCIDCQRQLQAAYYPFKGWHLELSDGILVGALGEYSGTLKQAIRSLKYESRPDVAKALGAALAKRWLLSSDEAAQTNYPARAKLYGVPIPLHKNRLAQRGYNQAALIAQSFCQASGMPMLAHGLQRKQDTLPQHQLGLAARQENLRQAFCVGDSLQRLQHRSKTSVRLLLIDDIYTTGATAQSAAEALEKAGMTVVGMLSLAKAVND
ncbi:MAG: ComF family protein [Cyanobacteria bacterium J06588_5]